MKVATCLAGSQMYYAYEIINVGHVGVYVVGFLKLFLLSFGIYTASLIFQSKNVVEIFTQILT